MTGTARDTKVWQEAIGLAGDVIRVVRRATRRETKAFTDALMLSATAVASAIIITALRMSMIRVRSVPTPSVVADFSPSSSMPSDLLSRIVIGTKMSTAIIRGGSSSI